MTLLLVLAALWVTAVFFLLALARAAASANEQMERVADRLGLPLADLEPRRRVPTHRPQRIVVRWWDPVTSYTVEV